MALYRRGTASMDADGTVHGTDTKWKDQLALIRVGATIVFLEQPIKLAVISDIVSDTELKAISTDGQTASDGKYVILLNDSLTVNGLAQNVAETLRYYQSKETEIAGAMDIIASLDMDNLNRIVEEIKANKSAAESAQNQAELARDSANAARDEAKATKGQVQQIVDGAVGSINAAKEQAITDVGSKESAAITHIDTEEKAAIKAINDAKGDLSGYVNNAQAAAQTATSAKNDAQAARDDAVSAKDAASVSAQEAKDAANSINADNLLTKDGNLSGLTNKSVARTNLDIDKFGLGLQSSAGLVNSLSEGNSVNLANGFYVGEGGNFGKPFGIGDGQFLGVVTFNCTKGNNYKFQLSGSYSSSGRMMFRCMNNGNYGAWKEVLTSASPSVEYGITIKRSDQGRPNQSGYIGVGGNDVYFKNGTSNRALQLRDDSSVAYDGRVIIDSDKTMVIGAGKDISQPNIGTWIKGMRDTGGSRVMRNTGAASAGGANFQYNAAIYMLAGDTFGLLSVDFRNANVYSIGANNSGLNSGVVQVNALWGTKNTTVDGNGFIKRASPIVRVKRDSFETNDESEGCTVQRIGVGEYLIEGCTGLNSDLAWGGISGGIEIPVDINKQPLLWVDYEVNADGSIILKTFHRTHESAPKFARNDKEGYSNGDPIDIPNDVFVSIRVEMPHNSIYNTELERMEREVRNGAKRSEWEEAHATGCKEE